MSSPSWGSTGCSYPNIIPYDFVFISKVNQMQSIDKPQLQCNMVSVALMICSGVISFQLALTYTVLLTQYIFKGIFPQTKTKSPQLLAFKQHMYIKYVVLIMFTLKDCFNCTIWISSTCLYFQSFSLVHYSQFILHPYFPLQFILSLIHINISHLKGNIHLMSSHPS